MQWVTVSWLLVLFLGTGCCQEPDAGSTAEDSVETNEKPYPGDLETMCADLEKDKTTQPCANDTEGIPITLEGPCGRGQTCQFRFFNCPLPFNNAQCHCRKIGGTLATIASACENHQIQLIVHRQCPAVCRVWIGLQKSCAAYHYTYINGHQYPYRNWEFGQPVRTGNQCVVLYIQSSTWSSSPCSASNTFICRV